MTWADTYGATFVKTERTSHDLAYETNVSMETNVTMEICLVDDSF